MRRQRPHVKQTPSCRRAYREGRAALEGATTETCWPARSRESLRERRCGDALREVGAAGPPPPARLLRLPGAAPPPAAGLRRTPWPIAIVSGALANKPFNGGEAWVRLSWVLGLRRLGFDVCFVEEIDAEPASTRTAGRPSSRTRSTAPTSSAVVERIRLDGAGGAALRRRARPSGLGLEELRSGPRDADLLVNISGHLTSRPIVSGPRTRVYVDLDPGFTQAWHADDDAGASASPGTTTTSRSG